MRQARQKTYRDNFVHTCATAPSPPNSVRKGRPPMSRSMIRYEFANGSEAEWHAEIARFIEALDTDPTIGGRVAYRVTRIRNGAAYTHLAAATDDDAVKALQASPFFKRYQEATRRVAKDGKVEVSAIELIAETK